MPNQSVALVTGVGRSIGIGSAIAQRLTASGATVATAGWRPYDERMPWRADAASLAEFECDFASPDGPNRLFADVQATYGTITTLVLCHCESVDSDIRTTTRESFDRHMAVNARATWLLVRAFAEQFTATAPVGAAPRRIVALTSDHTAFNLPYGASKGAMDRIVLAAATELAHLGVTANVINPGATDTGWMSDDVHQAVLEGNLQPRLGVPNDCAKLVRFLCSPEGQWVNGQLLFSNGGLRH
jgi:3-oxoacyl-[acyl-carrier protein] reductase